MEMTISFKGGRKVAAGFDGHTLMTDQPKESGGDGSAPSPFELFLASLGTCAGFFVLAFCQKRQIPTEGIELRQSMDWDPVKHLVTKVAIEIRVPKTFPEKYLQSLVLAAETCAVKRHLQDPPKIEIAAKAV
ncbi:MAG: OsmC family protein [Elusimicrobia bacterium]|nr:OsmC family protein [Elusimicrobiota bacterium]